MLEAYKPLFEFAEFSYFAQQILPLVVLLAIPAFALFARVHWEALSSISGMVLESLGLSIPWLWSSASSQGTVQSPGKKMKGKKAARTRAEQVATNGDAVHDGMKLSVACRTSLILTSESLLDEVGQDGDYLYYPGLVNISGTYCFLNSVLQVCINHKARHYESIY